MTNEETRKLANIGANLKGENLMKKILALAAVAALTAGVSAYAANPFSDVGMDHWAYQAVADLSAQGVLEGYPNGTFGGEKHITRYEVAQIVARLLAQESQLNAQQRATVEKLAAEYADELNNLGVRVSNLENKVGNVTWTGDARVKVEREYKAKVAQQKDYSDTFTGRVRLNLKAQANDKIAVKARLVSKFNFEDAKDNDKISVDKLHAEYAPVEGLTFDLGRTSATLGTGAWYDSDFDGVVASYEKGMFNVQAGYGRYRDLNTDDAGMLNPFFVKKAADGKLSGSQKFNIQKADKSVSEAYFVQGNVQLHEKVGVGAFYTHFAKAEANKKANAFWGVNGKVQLMDNVALSGDYVKATEKLEGHTPAFWDLGVDVNYKMFNFGVRYVDLDAGSYVGGSGLENIAQATGAKIGAKYWQATAGVALAKDISLDGYYNFDVQAKEYKNAAGNKMEKDTLYKAWGVSLNYAF